MYGSSCCIQHRALSTNNCIVCHSTPGGGIASCEMTKVLLHWTELLTSGCKPQDAWAHVLSTLFAVSNLWVRRLWLIRSTTTNCISAFLLLLLRVVRYLPGTETLTSGVNVRVYWNIWMIIWHNVNRRAGRGGHLTGWAAQRLSNTIFFHSGWSKKAQFLILLWRKINISIFSLFVIQGLYFHCFWHKIQTHKRFKRTLIY